MLKKLLRFVLCFFSGGIELFRGFLRSEFSEENLEFWIACQEYKQCEDSQMLPSQSQKIYGDFVAVQAPKEVRKSLVILKSYFNFINDFFFNLIWQIKAKEFTSWAYIDTFFQYIQNFTCINSMTICLPLFCYLQINLDSKTRMITVTNLEHPTRHAFEDAQKKIQALMEKDSYPRFLESDLYLQLLNNTPSSSKA